MAAYELKRNFLPICRQLYKIKKLSPCFYQKSEAHGSHSEKLQTARNMKAKALDISLIQEITGLTAEEIAEL